jgi:hypothetical protein
LSAENDLEKAQGVAGDLQNKFCKTLCGDPARIDLLFTMSEIPQAEPW